MHFTSSEFIWNNTKNTYLNPPGVANIYIYIYIYVSVKTYRYCICIENIDIKHQFKVYSKKISISTEIEKNRTIHTYGPSVFSALEHLPIAPQHRLCEACSSLVTCRFLLSLTARSIYLAKLWKFHQRIGFPEIRKIPLTISHHLGEKRSCFRSL